MTASKTMMDWVADFLAYRNSLGFEDITLKDALPRFARYCCKQDQSSHLTREIAVDWVASRKKAGPYYRRRLLGQIRIFAQYLSLFDPKTEIPELGLLGYAPYRRRPYIYSDEEIRRMIAVAETGKWRVPFWSDTLPAIIGLLSCTGMRPGEALRLRIADVNIPDRQIVIRESKSCLRRRIMIHETTAKALDRYLDTPIPVPRHGAPTFFRRERGRPIERRCIDGSFRYLRKWADLTAPPGERQPRLYDLRHTFVCRRLLIWYREDRNVQELLPALSAYVGHSEIDDTYWYLTATPELMALCSRKMEQFAEGGLQ
jgi:integrase